MKVEVNEFPDLQHVISRSTNRIIKSAQVQMELPRLGEKIEPVLREYSPIAGPDTFMTTGHNHTTIYDGWSRPITRGNPRGGADLMFMNKSEHVEVQRTGTEDRGYPIPLNPTGSTFWLGSPLKWGRSLPGGPGFVRFPQITHPGIVEPWGGRDFVEEAAEAFDHDWHVIMVEILKKVVFGELDKFFGKRRSD
jgi:hypothetical protein